MQDRVPEARIYKVWLAPEWISDDSTYLQLADLRADERQDVAALPAARLRGPDRDRRQRFPDDQRDRGRLRRLCDRTGLIATRHLAIEPGATILHNVITSKAVPEIVEEHGGTAIRTAVGHSLIKAEMARTGAVFGGEHSGHFYFREFYLADSGMLAALHVLAALAETETTVSELMAEFTRYASSGEINSRVEDADAVLADLEDAYAEHELDHLDGLTVTADDWWFNVRPSNTEPLLRLNVEGADEATMARVRDDVLGHIRS